MPSFTAIALDRLLEPGASKSVDKSGPSSNNHAVPKLKPPQSKPKPPLPDSNLEGRNSISTIERKASRPQISPALYATPESTPLPDSPTSFTPSPYIVNHKRRGPRLLKSYSEDDVSLRKKKLEKEKEDGNEENGDKEVLNSSSGHSVTFFIPDSVEGESVNGSPGKQEVANGVHGCPGEGGHVNGSYDGEVRSTNGLLETSNLVEKDVLMAVEQKVERDGDCDDFFDPQESMSYTSNTDAEDNNGAESSTRLTAAMPVGEFFDAWDELSSESGPSPFTHDFGAELCEMRLSWLMEIEKRKQAEEALNNMQNQWQRIRQQLAQEGLSLPACLIDVTEGDQLPDTNAAEELCQQVYLARFVSESIGRGIAKAEAEMEMEAQVEAKNFEIARLCDRLHYYEAMNQEMSQRNQEAVEMGRRTREARKRRRRWVWGSIATAITLGTAALAWSYLPATRGSSSSSSSADSHSSEHGGADN